MHLQLDALDPRTRALMAQEIRRDIAVGRLYRGAHLAEAGVAAWAELLLMAVETREAGWLTQQVSRTHFWVPEVPYRTRSGAIGYRRPPSDAPDRLAEGEFNRFYIRALALRAIEDGLGLEVIRVRAATTPRMVSELRIGMRVDPEALLRDLRENIGVDTALGVPAGPNSGLSVRLVAAARAEPRVTT